MSHKIQILSDGTRIDYGEGAYEYPLSLDLKITDYCETGCPWCHESSGKGGKHSDPDLLLSKLSGLPENTEIAIGGGNPLSHPDLKTIIWGLRNYGYIVNMTVRDTDLSGEIPNSLGWIRGLGISISPGHMLSPGDYLGKLSSEIKENIVAHMILGINSLEEYREVKKWFPRVLWLGFKQWGRNKNTPLPDLQNIRREIVQDLYLGRHDILAFDNLGINQLSLKDAFLKEEWEKYYLGPEFTSSMYVDAVKGEFSGYSTCPERTSWDDISLIDYFRKYATDIK